MSRYYDPDTTAWQCRCGHWNKIERETCSACTRAIDLAARCFAVDRRLSAAESTFFSITGPQILNELRQITALLRELKGNQNGNKAQPD